MRALPDRSLVHAVLGWNGFELNGRMRAILHAHGFAGGFVGLHVIGIHVSALLHVFPCVDLVFTRPDAFYAETAVLIRVRGLVQPTGGAMARLGNQRHRGADGRLALGVLHRAVDLAAVRIEDYGYLVDAALREIHAGLGDIRLAHADGLHVKSFRHASYVDIVRIRAEIGDFERQVVLHLHAAPAHHHHCATADFGLEGDVNLGAL